MLFPAQQMLVRSLKSVILCLSCQVLKPFILPAVGEQAAVNVNSTDTELLIDLCHPETSNDTMNLEAKLNKA